MQLEATVTDLTWASSFLFITESALASSADLEMTLNEVWVISYLVSVTSAQ